MRTLCTRSYTDSTTRGLFACVQTVETRDCYLLGEMDMAAGTKGRFESCTQ